jgi:hypothetical protein
MRLSGYSFAVLALLGIMGIAKAQGPDSSDDTPYALTVDFEPMDAVVERYGQTVWLQCVVDDDLGSSQPLEWYKDGEQIVEGEQYTINNDNGTLAITSALPEDVGEYECVLNLNNGQSFNKTVSLYSIPFVYPLDKSKNLVQGDPMHVECTVVGNPTPIISWFKDEAPLDESDSRLSLVDNKDGVANGTLHLTDLEFEDRAEYTCQAINEHGTSNSTMLVRVKDKLAALWPFLGICAEVAILVLIIFIYENRRAKKLEELDAKEEADHLTNSHTHKCADDVRQRK